MKLIPLDIITADKDENWLDQFFWPVNSVDLLKIRSSIEDLFYNILFSQTDELIRNSIAVVFNHFVRENLSLINSLNVLNGINEFDYKVNIEHQNEWQAITKHLVRLDSSLTPLYIPQRYPITLKRLIKKKYNNLKYWISGEISHSQYAVFAPGGLLQEIAERKYNNKIRIYDQSDFNMGRVNVKQLKDIDALVELIIEKLLPFYKLNTPALFDEIRRYLFYFHYEFIHRTVQYLANKSNLKIVSKNVILCSSGQNYFNRLLSVLSNQNKVKVMFHEHGETKALYSTSVHYYGEMGLSDYFVTYTKQSAETYKKIFAGGKNLKGNEPQFTVNESGAGSDYQKMIMSNSRKKILKTNRSILYVSGGFNNDGIFMGFRPHDMVYREWQIWLFRSLKSNGYDLYVKYHPGALLSNYTLNYPGGKELKGNFEDHTGRSDILLFDNSCSTAFQIACCTNMPLVFINNPVNELSKSTLMKLESRAATLNGFYDTKNRFRVNTKELFNAIENSDKNKSFDFVHEFICEIP